MLARIGHSLGRLLHYQLPCWTLIPILWPFCCFGYSLHHGHKPPVVADLHTDFSVCIKRRLMDSFHLSPISSGDWGAFPPPDPCRRIPCRRLVILGGPGPGQVVLFLHYLKQSWLRPPGPLACWSAGFLITCTQMPWLSREMGKSRGASSAQRGEPPSSVCAHTLLSGSGGQALTLCASWAKSFRAVKFFEHPNYASGHALNEHWQNCWGQRLLRYLIWEGEKR